MSKCQECTSENIIHNGAVSVCMECPPKQYGKADYPELDRAIEEPKLEEEE